MTNRLEHTYALLIGMDRLGDETFSHLSTTGEANAQALHSIIVGEDRCAYKLKNVISILGEEATRQNIINGFFELENRLRADHHAEKTALIYFSGFEIKNPEGVAPTYLIPHDVVSEIGGLFRSALNVNTLSGLIQSLPPSNLLFVSDSENLSLSSDGIIERPIPDPPPPPETEDEGNIGSKPIPNPAASLGQTLLFSTTGDEHSLTLHQHGISTFTWHLMEALSGYSDFARDGRTMVTAHEVWDYLRTKVPDTAAQMGQTQTPVGLSNEIDFPVGLLLGGRGLQGGQPILGSVDGNTLTRNSNTAPFENRVSISPEGKVFALLIGVNRYDYHRTVEGEFNLTGCVRDSEDVERFLKESIADPQDRLHIRKLRSLRIAEQHRSISPDVVCAEDAPPLPATRENVLAAFDEFLGQATAEDTVFIHFSGHGSFEFRPNQLSHIGGSSMDLNRGGVIMVQDSFIDREGERVYPFSDLEIRWLLRKVAANGPHIISAMDCCYAADITRNFNTNGITIRFATPPEAEEDEMANHRRPVNSYAFYEENKAILDLEDTSAFTLEQADKAVAIQACRENELSKEALFPEGKFGVFTYFFLQVLRATGGNISYRDLTKLVRARVKAKAGISFQSPVISATSPSDINLGFLSTEVVDNANLYLVRPTSETEAIMDAGSLHGLASTSTGTTFVDIYPHDVDIEEVDVATALSGRLTKVEAHRSRIQLEEGQTFPEGTALMKAVITLSPMPPTKVRFGVAVDGEEKMLADLPAVQQQELAAAVELLREKLGQQIIPMVAEAEANEGFQFKLVASINGADQGFYLRRREDNLQLATVEQGFNEDAATVAIEQLQHITRWESTLKLENEQPHKIQAGDVEIEIFDGGSAIVKDGKLATFSDPNAELEDGDVRFQDPEDPNRILPTDNGELVLEMRRNEDNDWVIPSIKIRVKMNKSDKHYHAGFVGLSKDFALSTQGWLPPSAILGLRTHTEDNIELTEGQIQYNINSGDFNNENEFVFDPNGSWQATDFFLSQQQIDNNITELEDHFKLIVSTEEFDTGYLEQASLANHVGTKNPSDREPTNQLEEFLRAAGGGTRNFRRRGSTGTKTTDWFTTSLTIKTILVES
ncbi:MAG: caspase family protein [Saprospiraceae bacterium]|nr:caspase family protein [Saprospiraceae bacterium]